MFKKNLAKALYLLVATIGLMVIPAGSAQAAQYAKVTAVKAKSGGKKEISFAKQKNAKKYKIQVKQSGKWKTIATTTKTKVTVSTKMSKKSAFRVSVLENKSNRVTTSKKKLGKLSVKQDFITFKFSTDTVKGCDSYQLVGYLGKTDSPWKVVNMKVSGTKAKANVYLEDIKSCYKWQVKGYKKTGGKKVCVASTKRTHVDYEMQNAKTPDGAKLDKRIVNLVNKERKKRGLVPVKWDRNLERGTKIRAKDLVMKCAHQRPEQNGTVFDNTMYPFTYMVTPDNPDNPLCASFTLNGAPEDDNQISLGENIASGYTNVNDVFLSWMESEGHRALILEPAARAVCYATYTDPVTHNKCHVLTTNNCYTEKIMEWRGDKLYVKPGVKSSGAVF